MSLPSTGTPDAAPALPDHRSFDPAPFWRGIPAYADVAAELFLDPGWQARNSVRSADQLESVLGPAADAAFIDDLRRGAAGAEMALRISPYILSRIDWSDPWSDPLRRQFFPLASEREPDHPALARDSLAELSNSPVPGLTRRYPDKALFLALDSCPVYCAFCTRSYAVGLETAAARKIDLRLNRSRWSQVFAWLAANPEVEDVVVSGGDLYNLRPRDIVEIGKGLLAIPSIRRIRLATKGLAVMPMRIGRDREWTAAVLDWVEAGRKQFVSVSLHTHFNHPNEISWITLEAAGLLFRHGVTVRNQSVLLRGVNDDPATLSLLVKRLGHLNIQPYYVYLHDMVTGMETFRTSLQVALDLEKHVRGRTAGFHTPTFVVDLPGGGGKRNVHSFETYDRASGVSEFRSPVVDPDRTFRYYDPLRYVAGRPDGAHHGA